MNPIKETAKPILKEITEPIGFKCKGVQFFRLLDGFVQSFKIYTMNGHCTIRFYMSPLSCSLDLRNEGEDISRFWSKNSDYIYVSSLMGIETPKYYIDNGIYIPLNNTQVETPQQAVDLLVSWFNKYLLPWFQNSLTLKKAFESEFDLWYNLEKNSQFDSKNAFKETEYFLAGKWAYWMLQIGNYEKAAYYLDLEVSKAIKRLRSSLPEHKSIYKKTLFDLKEFRDKIYSNDIDFINKRIKENTERTLGNLRLTKTKVWK